MKALGIIRRLDELGRIVIPKEIRKALRLNEGDALEIFADKNELVLKKYSPIARLEEFSEGSVKSLAKLCGKTVAIFDTDTVIFAEGDFADRLKEKKLSKEMRLALNEKKAIVLNEADGSKIISVVDDAPYFSSIAVVPLTNNDEIFGGIALFESGNEKLSAESLKLLKLCADLVQQQL